MALISTVLTLIYFGAQFLNKWEELGKTITFEFNFLDILRVRFADIEELEER